MCSPEHLEERKQAAAKYYNMVSPLHLLLFPSHSSGVLTTFAFVLVLVCFVVPRPYLRSGCHQPSSCRQVRTFETFPAYREDQASGRDRGLLGGGGYGAVNTDDRRCRRRPCVFQFDSGSNTCMVLCSMYKGNIIDDFGEIRTGRLGVKSLWEHNQARSGTAVRHTQV
jgi:hypothetical protein